MEERHTYKDPDNPDDLFELDKPSFHMSLHDTWYYTGVTAEQYFTATVESILRPIYLGGTIEQKSGWNHGFIVSEEEAFIDGFIEGYLTRIYGETEFSKLSVKLYSGTVLYTDIVDEGVTLSYISVEPIKISDIAHIETWKASPELADEVIRQHGLWKIFGPKLNDLD